MGTSELTLIAEIRPSLIPVPEPMTYATRPEALPRSCSRFESSGSKGRGLVGAGALEKPEDAALHSLVDLHDDDLQAALAVSFDGPVGSVHPRHRWKRVDPSSDIIFSHCSGYVGNSCFDGYPEFLSGSRASDQLRLFYAGTPNLTVDERALPPVEFRAVLRATREFPFPDEWRKADAHLPIASVPCLHVGPPAIKGTTDQAARAPAQPASRREPPRAAVSQQRRAELSSNDELTWRAIQLARPASSTRARLAAQGSAPARSRSRSRRATSPRSRATS